MKNKIVRFRVLALLLLLAMLASCVKGTDAAQTTDQHTDTEAETVSTEDYICISGGTYTLVRPDKANDNVLDIFRLLSNGLTELQGSRFSIGNDFVGYDQEIPQNNFEILIGLTNRNSSADVLNSLSQKQWKITVVGTHIVIVGADDAALRSAAEVFLNECVITLNGNLYIKKDLNKSGFYQANSNASLLPAILPDSQTQLLVTSSDGVAYTPDWVNDLIIVEANLANATEEGTLDAARRVIDHVADLGANGLWITPIGDRSGVHFYGNKGLHTIDKTLTGTSDYEEGWKRFKEFVDYAHSKNVRIFVDVVTWGTSADSPLYTEHPDWYTGEEEWSGLAFDWDNQELVAWYRETCVNMILETGIDGLRVDCEPKYTDYDLWKNIRQDCLDAGRKIVIFSEHSNTRDKAFDFEQFGVFNYGTTGFSDQQERKVNWFMGNTSIVNAVKNALMIGDKQTEIQNKTAYYRYFTYCVSCHDFSGTAVNGNILTLAYQALFTPFIPIWYLGEEFGWNGQGSLLYQKVDWSDAESPENAAFLEEIKELIAIRREHADVFTQFAENHRESNICAVKTTNLGDLAAYARYNDEKAILIVPNTSKNQTGTVTVPFSSMKMDSNATYQIKDLRSGEIIASGTDAQIQTFEASPEYQNLGIYLLEKQ